MGLLDRAFPGNQFSAWLDPNRNKVTGFFGGMVGGGNDPRGTLQGAINGLQGGVAPDNAFVQQQQLQAEKTAAVKAEQDKQNATIQWLQQNAPKYAAAVANGAMTPADAWTRALSDSQPAKPDIRTVGDALVSVAADGSKATPIYDPNAATGGIDSKEAFNREKELNAQYVATDPVKTYQVVRNGYEKVRSASKQDTGPGDVSMIFAFMKMLDPTSVVREGEFATAQNTAGIPQTVVNLYNQAISGVRLGKDQRDQFMAAADAIYADAAKNLEDTNTLYKGRATPWGVDPSRFLLSPETYSTVPPTANDPLGLR